MNSTLIALGRIIYALAIAFIGLGHFTATKDMSAMVPSSLSAMIVPVTYLTGACVLLAAISFIVNKWTRWSGLLMALFLLLTILLIHVPGLSSADPVLMKASMGNAVKDAGLMGAALMIAGLSGK